MSNLTLTEDTLTVGEIVVDNKSTNLKGENNKVVHIDVVGDFYKKSLEQAGLDIETVKKVNQHDAEYLTNLYKASAVAAAKVIEKSPEIDRVIIKAPFGSDKLTSMTSSAEVTVNKAVSVRIPGNDTPEIRPNIALKVNSKSHAMGAEAKKVAKESLAALQKLIK